MNDLIVFLEQNYGWIIPSVVGLILTIATFCKKGSITKADADKIMTAVSIIGSATSLLMEKEVKKNEKISSTKESKEVSQD